MKIVLPNRYGIKIYLESFCINSPTSYIDDGNNYKLTWGSEDTSYVRCGFVENDTRNFEYIDPDGGPFLTKGGEYVGTDDTSYNKPIKFKILSIYSPSSPTDLDLEPGFYFNIKLIEENEQ